MEVEIEQLVPYEGWRREKEIVEGARDVAGNFLKDMLPISALNASYQPNLLH